MERLDAALSLVWLVVCPLPLITVLVAQSPSETMLFPLPVGWDGACVCLGALKTLISSVTSLSRLLAHPDAYKM